MVFACCSPRLAWYGPEHHWQSIDEWRGVFKHVSMWAGKWCAL